LNLFNLKEITSFHLLHLKFKKLSVVKCKYRKIVISTNHFHQRPTSLTIIEDEDQDEVEAQNLETKKKSIGIVLLKHSRLEIRANFAWNNARLNNEVITFSWISNFIPFGSYQQFGQNLAIYQKFWKKGVIIAIISKHPIISSFNFLPKVISFINLEISSKNMRNLFFFHITLMNSIIERSSKLETFY